MELFEKDTFVPVNKKGKHLDLTHSVTMESEAAAITLYNTACKRLLNPYTWHELAGSGTAEFSIYESNRNHKGPVQINTRLFIDVVQQGMGNDSHDWVVVEDIKQQVVQQADESLGLRLRVCSEPDDPENKASHFFTGSATSTLIISRIENVVSANYYGRNEIPNIETGHTLENIRNAVIALGAMVGLSKLQWTALIKNLLS